jgi:hypothetical protein
MEVVMRTLEVGESTYAAIWAAWKEGDDGEEGVIRRLLGLKISGSNGDRKKTGFRDKRYGVEFPEGFRIFRTFKGKDYWAIAQNGVWVRENNRHVPSLNQLSAQIGAPTENAWTGWHYDTGEGVAPIATLRDPARVRRRS